MHTRTQGEQFNYAGTCTEISPILSVFRLKYMYIHDILRANKRNLHRDSHFFSTLFVRILAVVLEATNWNSGSDFYVQNSSKYCTIRILRCDQCEYLNQTKLFSTQKWKFNFKLACSLIRKLLSIYNLLSAVILYVFWSNIFN